MTLTDKKKRLILLYKDALNQVKSELMRLQEKYGNDISYGQLQNLNRLKNLDKTINKEISSLTNKTITVTNDAVLSLYEKSYNIEVDKIPTEIKEVVSFGVLDKSTVENAIDNDFKSVILKNNTNLQTTVNKEIANGLIQGKPYDIIAKKVTERFNVGANSALKVIRTETHKVVNKAKADVFDDVKASADRLGYKIVKKWLCAKDSRTRDTHREMNGKEADENGWFILSSGVKTPGPGLSGVAEEDINCRCTTITEIKKD